MYIWILFAFLDWLIISGCFCLLYIFDYWYVYILSCLVIGNRQHALHILGHDGVHRLICKNKRLNDFLTCLFCFWPLWTSLKSFRKFHFDHHRYLGTLNDPEIKWKNVTPANEKPLTFFRILRWTIFDIIGGGVLSFKWLIKEYKINFRGIFIFWVMLFLIFYSANLFYILIIWHIAFICVFIPLFKSLAYTQHWRTTTTHKFKPPFLLKQLIFPHNIWAHYEHHKDPKIKFYNLKKTQ